MQVDRYIKKEIRAAIKNARTIILYSKKRPPIVLGAEKKQDWTNFIKEALKTKEFNTLVLYHQNNSRTKIEVYD